MKQILAISAALATGGLVASCGGDGTSCGDGTVEASGTCVIDPTVCGDGTSLVDGSCVPEQGQPGAAPEITSIATDSPFPGGGFLELHGSGFNVPDGGTFSVTIGGEATEVLFAIDSLAVVVLPRAASIETTVEATNSNGSDSIEFAYTGFLVADGRCNYGSLHLTDPRNGFSVPLGPIQRDPGNGDPVVQYSVSGIAFASDGTLYGSAVCNDNLLLTIDPNTGAATVVGPITSDNGATSHYNVPDLGFLGGTLYGWTESSDDLMEISTVDGSSTVLGDSQVSSWGSGIEAYDDTQLIGTVRGDQESAYLLSTAGVATPLEPALTGEIDDAIAGLTKGPGGYYGVYGDSYNGLLHIDFTTGTIEVLGTISTSDADGIAVPPSFEAKVSQYAHTKLAPRAEWDAHLPATARKVVQPLGPRLGAAALKASDVFGKANVTRGESVALTAYLARSGQAFAAGATQLTVLSGRDQELSLPRAAVAAGRYELRANQKGRLKLVEAKTGKTLARDVVSFRAN